MTFKVTCFLRLDLMSVGLEIFSKTALKMEFLPLINRQFDGNDHSQPESQYTTINHAPFCWKHLY